MLDAFRVVGRSSRRRLARLSIGQALAGYVLAKTADNRAPATIETIEKRCGRLVAFVGADRDLRSVTVDELRRWIVQLKRGQRGRPTSDIYVEDHRKEAAAVATITVHGVNARGMCSQIYFADGTPTYRRSGELTSVPVVCEYDARGRHFTVRDQGALNIYGGLFCEWVRRLDQVR